MEQQILSSQMQIKHSLLLIEKKLSWKNWQAFSDFSGLDSGLTPLLVHCSGSLLKSILSLSFSLSCSFGISLSVSSFSRCSCSCLSSLSIRPLATGDMTLTSTCIRKPLCTIRSLQNQFKIWFHRETKQPRYHLTCSQIIHSKMRSLDICIPEVFLALLPLVLQQHHHSSHWSKAILPWMESTAGKQVSSDVEQDIIPHKRDILLTQEQEDSTTHH